jgi:hypothetical protein
LLVVEELIWLGSSCDFLLIISGIPKDLKGYLSLSTERVMPHRVKDVVEETAQEGKMSEALYPQQKIPWRRSRPKKNKEAEETRVPSEPHARSAVEELLMRAIRLEPIGGTNQEI